MFLSLTALRSKLNTEVVAIGDSMQPQTRAALLVFVLLPIALVGAMLPLSARLQATVLRVIFLCIVCFLPGTMWCLFLLTRKASLLGECLSNLSRLGLLRQIGDEDRATAKLRVKSYIQRFEARYGGLPNIARKKVLETLCACSEAEAEAHGCSPKPLSTGFVPVVLATVLITFGWIITLPPWSFLSHVHFPIASPIWIALRPACNSNTLAFRGAYFFSLQMLFRRYVLKDLSGAAYIAISIRIVMAGIDIWAVATLAGTHITPSLLNLMGFAFGMFPRVIWQVVATSLKRAVGVIVPSLISQLPLSDLDGLTVWHEARLEEEDVENIPNMATADLVDLFLDTRLAPERLIDWTDHAILFTQLGPQEKGKDVRHALRALGIRTATSFLEAAKVECREDRELLNGIISPQARTKMRSVRWRRRSQPIRTLDLFNSGTSHLLYHQAARYGQCPEKQLD